MDDAYEKEEIDKAEIDHTEEHMGKGREAWYIKNGKVIDITSTRTIDFDTNLIYDLNSKNCRIVNKTNSEKGSFTTEVCVKNI